MTSIEWTDRTWNVLTGCTKISPGCAHCYAADIAKRFWGDRPFSDVQFHPERLAEPLKWRKPAMVFVNSMADLFHESATDEQLDQIFAVMAQTQQHIYQVLTKRPDRMLQYLNWRDRRQMPTLPNVWLGVTVENQKTAYDRIPLILETPAAVRFLSCEPLLEAVALPLRIDAEGRNITGLSGLQDDDSDRSIDWVIVGGESGNKARPFALEWGLSIVNQCQSAGVPVFVKQLGSNPIYRWNGETRPHPCKGKGNDIAEFPPELQIREFPQVQAAIAGGAA